MLRTRKQVKTICTGCPLARTANLLGDTPTLLIVRDLLDSPRRFSDIETSLPGVSTRTITKKLQLLEAKKLVLKQTGTSKPAPIVYTLTKEGRALRKIIETMRRYGESYL